jgi:hypothetical protein
VHAVHKLADHSQPEGKHKAPSAEFAGRMFSRKGLICQLRTLVSMRCACPRAAVLRCWMRQCNLPAATMQKPSRGIGRLFLHRLRLVHHTTGRCAKIPAPESCGFALVAIVYTSKHSPNQLVVQSLHPTFLEFKAGSLECGNWLRVQQYVRTAFCQPFVPPKQSGSSNLWNYMTASFLIRLTRFWGSVIF